MHLASLNVTSLDAHWDALSQLRKAYNVSVIALQETRHPAGRMATYDRCIRTDANGAWRPAWGPPPKNSYVHRSARGGGTDHLVKTTIAQQGGVCVAAQGALVQTSLDDPSVRKLRDTTRWTEAFIPLPVPTDAPRTSARRARGRKDCTVGFYVASLYANPMLTTPPSSGKPGTLPSASGTPPTSSAPTLR